MSKNREKNENKKEEYCMCDECEEIMNRRHKATKQLIKDKGIDLKKWEVSIGKHSLEKARIISLSGIEKEDELKENELPGHKTLDKVKEAIRLSKEEGELIEVQIGQYDGELKYIYNFQDPATSENRHAIFLYTKNQEGKQLVSIINLYNPNEGMSFKWSEDGRKRMYLNSLRSCCPHPEDKKEYYNKKHHGVRHRDYDYKEKQEIKELKKLRASKTKTRENKKDASFNIKEVLGSKFDGLKDLKRQLVDQDKQKKNKKDYFSL